MPAVPQRDKGPLFATWGAEIEAGEARRLASRARLDAYQGQFVDHVRSLIPGRVRDKESAAEIAKFVTASHNLAASAVEAVNVAYRSGCRRTLARGADAAAVRAFHDLVQESGLPALAPNLAALAWISGPVLLLPTVQVVRGVPRLRVESVTADRFEVKRTGGGDEVDAALVFRGDGSFLVVDGTRHAYYDPDGWPLAGGAFDREHGCAWCPASIFRARRGLDFWGASDHRELIDGTHEIAYLWALGRWVRTQTQAPLTAITGPEDKIPKLQAIGHPSRPLVLAGVPAEFDVKVLDRSTDPEKYLSEIRALAAACVQRVGLPPGAVSLVSHSGEWGTLAVAMTPAALASQRDRAVPFLRAAEVEAWSTVAEVVRASGHRHARALPDAATFEAQLRVAFPDLNDADEQAKRMAALKERLPLGLANPIHELMAQRPELSPEDAEEELQENLRNYIDVIVPLVERNAPADPGPARGVETLAQQNGRQGGEVSGQVRRAAADAAA